MIHFTADCHFGHANIIKLCNRPFASLEEMNEALIVNWNDKIGRNDTVYIIGDLFFWMKEPEIILDRLKGKKHLILGNHDKSWIKKVDIDKHFESVDTLVEVSDGQHGITLCHYPLLSWDHAQRTYMIHGHIHNNTNADFWPLLVKREHALNAGCDVNGFAPVTFDELVENNRRFKEIHSKADALREEMDMMTEIDLGITQEEYKVMQEIVASIDMTVDEAVTYLFKAIIARKEEILSRFENGEPAMQIMEEVVAVIVKEMFGKQNG